MSHPDPQNTNVSLHLSEMQLTATHEHIIDFIDDQVTAAAADGAIIALSSGIDSTRTARTNVTCHRLQPPSSEGGVFFLRSAHQSYLANSSLQIRVRNAARNITGFTQ